LSHDGALAGSDARNHLRKRVWFSGQKITTTSQWP